MKGSVRVLVFTKRLRYELNLHRNITIIQGDSASGKTTMIQIIGDYLSRRAGPGTEVVCDRKCVVLSGGGESALAQLSVRRTLLYLWTSRSVFCIPSLLQRQYWNRTVTLYL